MGAGTLGLEWALELEEYDVVADSIAWNFKANFTVRSNTHMGQVWR